jgi:hypothetical protein
MLFKALPKVNASSANAALAGTNTIDETPDPFDIMEAIEVANEDLTDLDDLNTSMNEFDLLASSIENFGLTPSLHSFVDAEGLLSSAAILPAFEALGDGFPANSNEASVALENIFVEIKEMAAAFVAKIAKLGASIVEGGKKLFDGLVNSIKKMTGRAEKLKDSDTVDAAFSPAAAGSMMALAVLVPTVIGGILAKKIPTTKEGYRALYESAKKSVQGLKAGDKFKAVGTSAKSKDKVGWKWSGKQIRDLYESFLRMFAEGGAMRGLPKKIGDKLVEAGGGFQSAIGRLGGGAMEAFRWWRKGVMLIGEVTWQILSWLPRKIWKIFKMVQGKRGAAVAEQVSKINVQNMVPALV